MSITWRGITTRKKTPMRRADRERLADRQGGFCWWCGHRLPMMFAVHHRKLRKHGGGDDPSNLVCLHHACHNGVTGSVHLQPGHAYERGFLVHSWDDPTLVPVTANGLQVLLHADGTITREEDAHVW